MKKLFTLFAFSLTFYCLGQTSLPSNKKFKSVRIKENGFIAEYKKFKKAIEINFLENGDILIIHPDQHREIFKRTTEFTEGKTTDGIAYQHAIIYNANNHPLSLFIFKDDMVTIGIDNDNLSVFY